MIVGETFGHYHIERSLGLGQAARVYLARDLRMNRPVALKVLHPAIAEDDRGAARFRAEGRRMVELEHENIVPVYEVDELDGLGLYIAMRYVEGGDLAALLRQEGPLEPGRVAAIAIQIGRALDVIHSRSLVYRDLKPANVLVAPGPRGGEHVYLGDLGFVREEMAELATRLSLAGEFLGTSAYMAPEQIEGDDVDARADVYGFGCLLFELLTGEPPFGRVDTPTCFRAHLASAPPRVTQRRPGLPEGLDGVLRRALAKSRDDRHATCGELAQAVVVEARALPLEQRAAAPVLVPDVPRAARRLWYARCAECRVTFFGDCRNAALLRIAGHVRQAGPPHRAQGAPWTSSARRRPAGGQGEDAPDQGTSPSPDGGQGRPDLQPVLATHPS
jgi:serine/threonine protein kinase